MYISDDISGRNLCAILVLKLSSITPEWITTENYKGTMILSIATYS